MDPSLCRVCVPRLQPGGRKIVSAINNGEGLPRGMRVSETHLIGCEFSPREFSPPYHSAGALGKEKQLCLTCHVKMGVGGGRVGVSM